MYWANKFKIANQFLQTEADIDQDFYIKENGASTNAISTLNEKYSFIPEEYFKFLSISDGADIAQCTLFSSLDYAKGKEMYSNAYPEKHWFPFGHESGGDPLLLHESGKVAIGFGKNISGKYNFICDNFSDFLGEVLMGPKYPLLFRIKTDAFNEFIEEESEDDPWLAFLIKQNWLNV